MTPIPAPNLDDRSFQDIVDEAKRLIPRYTPEWTNHNVSDPGVALIELFAWMSEMVLFRVNQVPDRLYVHFLNLVGVEPFPPSVARVDLTFWLSAVLDQTIIVPAGTEVGTATAAADAVNTGQAAVVFATVHDLVIAPPELIGALTITAANLITDVWDDLRFAGSSALCFGSDPLSAGDALYIGLAENTSGLALRLGISAQAEGIGVDPHDPPLIWESWNGEGWVELQVFSDSTGGLNRAGDIVVLIGPEAQLLTLGGIAAYWLRARLLAPKPGQPTYQQSPRIGSLTVSAVGGTTAAEHTQSGRGEMVGRSDGRAGQVFAVSQFPVLPRSEGENVRITDVDGAESWIEVADFSRSGPTDLHVVWDNGTGELRFGPRVRYADGSVRQHGRIPRDGAQIAVTGYRYGGGASGNVGAGTITTLRSTLPYVASVVNLRPSLGGVDGETIEEAKIRGPLTLRSGQRAVTASDFERLTLESSVEVARARCLPAVTGQGPIRMLVVPNVRSHPRDHRLDDFAIPAALMTTVGMHLDAHRVVGTAVEISTPYFQGVSVAALIFAVPGRPAPLVRQRAIDALTEYINPLAGGADGVGWPFDRDLNAAAVAQLLESVEGVERVDEVLLFEYDLREGRRLGSGKDIIRLDPQSLFLSAAHQVVVR
jgi:predicted phage baseplate assembly protein